MFYGTRDTFGFKNNRSFSNGFNGFPISLRRSTLGMSLF